MQQLHHSRWVQFVRQAVLVQVLQQRRHAGLAEALWHLVLGVVRIPHARADARPEVGSTA